MTRRLKAFAKMTRLGLIGVGLALIAGIAIYAIWGSLLGLPGWRGMSAALMIGEILLFVGIEALLRPPNPYGRLNPQYELRDLGPTGELYSSDPGWLWHALPLVLGAIVLVLTLTWF